MLCADAMSLNLLSRCLRSHLPGVPVGHVCILWWDVSGGSRSLFSLCKRSWHLRSFLPDPKAGLTPLFEVQLDLVIPDLVFRPSLDPGANDGFYDMVESLLNDIYRISSLVPRLAEHSGFPHYQVRGCGTHSGCMAVRRYHAAPASLCYPLLSSPLLSSPRLTWRTWLIWLTCAMS